MRIITLTLNPAFDMHCFAKELTLYRENFLECSSLEAGGKGINISRALLSNGIESEAVVIVGKENAEQYLSALKREGLTVKPVFTNGRIRENITIHEGNAPETRISFNGFYADRTLLDDIKNQIGKVDENTIITFTGSIPDGIRVDYVLNLLDLFRVNGAKIVIDSRSVTFDELIKFSPWLIKPNSQEIEEYIGRPIKDIYDAVMAAEELHKAGIENAMITLGGDGAVLVSDEGSFVAIVPKIDAVSTIGAGDSTIAGFIDGVLNKLDKQSVLKRAVAFGSAACLTAGSRPPLLANIEKLLPKITVSEI